MSFYRPKNAELPHKPHRCLKVFALLFLLMSCGLDVKNGLARRGQESEGTFDEAACAEDSDPVVREFLVLRRRLATQSPNCSAALDRLARSQSDWLQQNPDLKQSVKPHEQREGTPGFSGVTLAARLQRQNLKSETHYIAETVAQGDFSGDIWRAHLGSVLHRSIFLAPGLTAFGYAQNHVATVLTAAVSVSGYGFEPVFYPTQAEVVGTGRLLSERPAQDLAVVGMGYPISVHFPWGCSDLRVSSFIVQHAGKELASKIFTKRELAKLNASEVFLVTDEVLPRGEVMDVSAKITCGSQVFQKVWQFYTLG